MKQKMTNFNKITQSKINKHQRKQISSKIRILIKDKLYRSKKRMNRKLISSKRKKLTNLKKKQKLNYN